MKKIITLILAAGLVSTAAFAQDHRHSYDNRYNENSYQNQYPLNYGYSYYDNDRNRHSYENQFGYDRYDRDRDRRMMYRHHRRYYDDYRNRSGLSLHVVIGNRRRF
jgi:hypothetical protein